MNERRRQDLERLPDGRIVDHAAVRAWLAAMTPTPRPALRRLSESMPELQVKGR